MISDSGSRFAVKVVRCGVHEIEQLPQQSEGHRKPNLTLIAAGNAGTLVIRSAAVSGEPYKVQQTTGFSLSADVEETATARFDLSQSHKNFKTALAIVLDDIRKEITVELDHKRMLDATAADANVPVGRRVNPQATHLNITVFVQSKPSDWRKAALEVTPARHISLSIPVALSPERARQRLNVLVEATRRAAISAREHGL